jgi:hypothetical protein
VFGTLGRRALESVVGLFALLGFAFVPLGSKTGLEHTIAVCATPSVRDAAAGLMAAIDKAKTRLLDALAPDHGQALPLPLPSGNRRGGHAIRPVVPALPADAKIAPNPSPAPSPY